MRVESNSNANRSLLGLTRLHFPTASNSSDPEYFPTCTWGKTLSINCFRCFSRKQRLLTKLLTFLSRHCFWPILKYPILNSSYRRGMMSALVCWSYWGEGTCTDGSKYFTCVGSPFLIMISRRLPFNNFWSLVVGGCVSSLGARLIQIPFLNIGVPIESNMPGGMLPYWRS